MEIYYHYVNYWILKLIYLYKKELDTLHTKLVKFTYQPLLSIVDLLL